MKLIESRDDQVEMMGVKISNEVRDGIGSIEEGESYPVGEIRMGKYIKGDIRESMGSIDP